MEPYNQKEDYSTHGEHTDRRCKCRNPVQWVRKTKRSDSSWTRRFYCDLCKPEPKETNFSVALRTRRKREGLTQVELAELVSVTSRRVSVWETGQDMPNPKNLKTLKKIFNWKFKVE